MVAAVNSDRIGWISPAPLWSGFGDLSDERNRDAFVRPAILRFAHDEFMDEVMAVLAYSPNRLGEWRAIPETWENPAPTPTATTPLDVTEPVSRLSTDLRRLPSDESAPATTTDIVAQPGDDDSEGVLKLFQPVQQRHYMITASLVCRRPGLPDRRVDPGKQEQASYVIRRLIATDDATELPTIDRTGWQEHAFVRTANTQGWQPVASESELAEDHLLPGEERLPMFRLAFEESVERNRHLLGGVIPVGRRETYVGARVLPPVDNSSLAQSVPVDDETPDPRLFLFQMRVTGPWSELVLQNMDQIEKDLNNGVDSSMNVALSEAGVSPPPNPPGDINTIARNQAQTVSWYILLDFERFLYNHVRNVWRVLANDPDVPILDPLLEQPLLTHLERIEITGVTAGSANLRQVLERFAQDQEIGERLESVEFPYPQDAANWPTFRFPLADVGTAGPFPFVVNGVDRSGFVFAGREQTLANVVSELAQLETFVEQALPPRESARLPETTLPTERDFAPGDVWFVIRCVYERPNCGPFNPAVLSEPTKAFQMASFFDPEAPARAIRIPLPLDTSTAGLRKFNKNATMMVSDMLCGQIRRIRKLSLGDLVLSVLPWPFHKDLPDPGGTGPCGKDTGNTFGMFCSLSIPIVTLCALILLIIMVSLFDLFFRWLPYLFVCLPIPGFKGKKT